MKKHVLGVMLGVAVAALAMASVKTTLLAFGQGVAVNEHGVRALVRLEASKVTHRDEVRMAGNLLLDTSQPEHPGPRVTMRTIREMAVDGNVARFAGPGVLRIPTNKGAQEFEGHVSVVVTSWRHPGEMGDMDTIFVRFAREGGPVFEFAGRMHEGDLSVQKTVDY